MLHIFLIRRITGETPEIIRYFMNMKFFRYFSQIAKHSSVRRLFRAYSLYYFTYSHFYRQYYRYFCKYVV